MTTVEVEVEVEVEMEMVAAEDIGSGTDLFPLLSPLTFSLYDSFLTSHCSSCFSLLSPPPSHSPLPLYCSALCSLPDSTLISPPDISPLLSSDIRAASRLLNSIPSSALSPHRLGGLLTNHHRFMADPSISLAIQRAADFIAAVSRSDRRGSELEEAAICAVLTNAVEVQDSTGKALGIAVYGPRFSWINHSCSPNACYRFVISPPSNNTTSSSFPKIIPHITNKETVQVGVCSLTSLWEGKTVNCGPKVTTRSIKKIKSGEEITISYIDILQPTGLRQSDLWLKYQFLCCCGRCAASPPAYVDSLLEEVLAFEPENIAVVHRHETTDKNEAVAKMTDHIKEAIDDFLSDNIDSTTCCEKIESVLHRGIWIKADSHLRLHPVHHVALNAYITLATAYKIRSVDSESDMGKAFDMRRVSAAYSLFLAGVSHHLFSAEPSLAISVARFWTTAGESLLDFGRKFLLEPSGQSDVKCSKCLALVEIHNSQRDIKEILRQIVRCVADISQEVWGFVSRDCPYLEKFRSPVDFNFTGTNGKIEASSKDQMTATVWNGDFKTVLGCSGFGSQFIECVRKSGPELKKKVSSRITRKVSVVLFSK